MKTDSILIGLLLILTVVFSALVYFDDSEVPTADEIAALIVVPEVNITINSSDKFDKFYEDYFLEESIEEIAEKLALEELESKDFKKDLVKYLADGDVEGLYSFDYKDITKIKVTETNVDVSGEDAEVDFEFKIYVNNYGDSEEVVKALLSVTFLIEDLDEDEDFEDAEFYDFEDLQLIKIFD